MAVVTEQNYGLSKVVETKTTSPDVREGRKVAFLFMHEQAHPIPHSLPLLNSLASTQENCDIHVYVRGQLNSDFVKSHLSEDILNSITIKTVSAPWYARLAEKLVGGAIPFGRIGLLFAHRKQFRNMDYIVCPDTTCLFLKKHFGCEQVKFVHTKHGAGDRAVGFKKAIRDFDHSLVAGEKIRDRAIQEEIGTEDTISVVGYQKFDFVNLPAQSARTFFNNDRPVVLYNPHFDPSLSSWYRHGEQVLDYFAASKKYNLIFAPHVMLFSRKLHVASDKSAIAWRKGLAKQYAHYPNIHIDTGSSASIDMTYTTSADIYLGDVSSQVYEFIYNPRPCLFLNSHELEWRDNPNFAHWHLGAVLSDIDQLDYHLDQHDVQQLWYRERQIKAFNRTFGDNIEGAADRAAAALTALF